MRADLRKRYLAPRADSCGYSTSRGLAAAWRAVVARSLSRVPEEGLIQRTRSVIDDPRHVVTQTRLHDGPSTPFDDLLDTRAVHRLRRAIDDSVAEFPSLQFTRFNATDQIGND